VEILRLCLFNLFKEIIVKKQVFALLLTAFAATLVVSPLQVLADDNGGHGKSRGGERSRNNANNDYLGNNGHGQNGNGAQDWNNNANNNGYNNNGNYSNNGHNEGGGRKNKNRENNNYQGNNYQGNNNNDQGNGNVPPEGNRGNGTRWQ